MEYGSHIKLLSLTMIAVMLITCAAVFTSEENDGSGGINSSSESNPYTGIDFQFSYSGPGFLNNIYVLEGSYVSIDGEIDSVNNYMVGFSSVTSGYGLSLTRHTTDGTVPNDIISGTLSRSGTITIEATIASSFGVNNNTYTIYVVADTTSVTSVSISGSTSGEVGDSITLTASTSPSSADNRHVTWSITSGSNYASIRSQTDTTTGGRCVIDLDRAGTVTVRATADDGSGEYDTHRITITEPEVLVTSVSISGSTSVNIGSSITLRATTSPSDADDRHVNWSITSGSNRVSYTVSDTSTGGTITLTGLSAGSVTVRATAVDGSGEYDTHTVTVVQPVVNITTSQGDVTIIAGQEFSLNVSTNVSGCTIGVSGADWLSVSGSTVSGTPDSPGEFDITITASRSGYTSDSISFTITVVSALGFTNEPSNGVTVYVVS